MIKKSYPHFPKHFLWGVANSAFQVEGRPENSDWKNWTELPGKIKDSSHAEVVGLFWEDYEKDISLAKDLGCKVFRLSLAWERIQPEPNRFSSEALNHYKKILEFIRQQGMKPSLTLNHFVLPHWLAEKGGYASKEFPLHFVNFAVEVYRKLAPDVQASEYWMTFNEPGVVALQAYITGEWPPGKHADYASAALAIAHMAEAHVEFLKSIHGERASSPIQWGFAHHIRDFQALTNSAFDRASTKFIHWIFNDQFVDSVVDGKIFAWMPGTLPSFKRIKTPADFHGFDFLGINYYGRMMVKPMLRPPFIQIEEGSGPKTDLHWEIYPEGLYQVCMKAWKKYKKPIFIAENGLADSADRLRSDFISQHLKALDRSLAAGVPILGYCHWTLTDNFEWAEGLKPKFGLVELKKDLNGIQRIKRDSFFHYQTIIGSLDSE